MHSSDLYIITSLPFIRYPLLLTTLQSHIPGSFSPCSYDEQLVSYIRCRLFWVEELSEVESVLGQPYYQYLVACSA